MTVEHFAGWTGEPFETFAGWKGITGYRATPETGARIAETVSPLTKPKDPNLTICDLLELLMKRVHRLEHKYKDLAEIVAEIKAAEKGPQGDPGPQGPQGIMGPRGSLWFTGQGEPMGIVGVRDRDLYLDLQTGNIWTYQGTRWVRLT